MAEIIDHIARSIVADKIKEKEILPKHLMILFGDLVLVNWNSLDGWIQYTEGQGGITDFGGGKLLIMANTAAGSIIGIHNNPVSVFLWDSPFYAEIRAREASSVSANQVIMFGVGCTDTRYYQVPEDYACQFAGFLISGNKLYAELFRMISESEFEEYSIEIPNIDIKKTHIYAVEFEPNEYIKWYVDNELNVIKDTDLPNSGYPTPTFSFEVWNQRAGQSKRLIVSNCIYTEKF
jgi:hypothetical protein